MSELGFPLPPNTYVAEYLPHDVLLPKVDVMVTNGGYGAVQRALSTGVPLVVAGDTEDKPEVAARVAWSGAGDRPANRHAHREGDPHMRCARCSATAAIATVPANSEAAYAQR